MNRTEGYCKTYIEVSYLNNEGDKQHIASFQIHAGKNLDDAFSVKERFEQRGVTVLAPHVQAYISTLTNAGYDLQIICRVMV